MRISIGIAALIGCFVGFLLNPEHGGSVLVKTSASLYHNIRRHTAEKMLLLVTAMIL
jgi:hypothetical protein